MQWLWLYDHDKVQKVKGCGAVTVCVTGPWCMFMAVHDVGVSVSGLA